MKVSIKHNNTSSDVVYTIRHLKSKTYFGFPTNHHHPTTTHHGHNLLLFNNKSSASFVAQFVESNHQSQSMEMMDIGVLVLSAPKETVHASTIFRVEESSMSDVLSLCKGSGVVPSYFSWTEDPSSGVTCFELVHLPDEGTKLENVNYLSKCLKKSGKKSMPPFGKKIRGMNWFLMLLLHIIQ